MAYDPEARAQSNSAMIIGVVALVLLVGGALAYLSTRNPNPDVAVVPAPARDTVVVEQPAPAPASPVVIEKPSSTVVVTPPVTRTVERNTTVTRERAVPATPPARSAETRTETNVTVNVPPTGGGSGGSTEPNRTTLQPQAGSDPAEPAPTAAQ